MDDQLQIAADAFVHSLSLGDVQHYKDCAHELLVQMYLRMVDCTLV